MPAVLWVDWTWSGRQVWVTLRHSWPDDMALGTYPHAESPGSILCSPAPLQTPPVTNSSDYYGANASETSDSAGLGAAAHTPKQSSAAMSHTTSDMRTGGVPIPGTLFSPPTPAPSPQPSDANNEYLSIWNGHSSPSETQDLKEFGDRFIESVVEHYPRLTLPQRRNLFTALLPHLQGEDLLHLSQLISPHLRRDFLAELPAEISLQILAFIDDPKDLVRASRVSMTWRSLVSDEQTWKVMLQRYRGRGWPARSTRPPIERIRMIHPEATFRTITTSPTLQNSQTDRAALPSHLQISAFQQSYEASNSSAQTHARRISALSPTAQPFRSHRPSLSVQTAASRSVGPSSAPESSGLGSNVLESASNQFLEETHIPPLERKRFLKGKKRALRTEKEATIENQTEAPAGSAPSPAKLAGLLSDGAPAWEVYGLGLAARRQASQKGIKSPNAPPRRPIGSILLPPPQDLTQHMQRLCMADPPSTDIAGSPTARFASNMYSPAVPLGARPSQSSPSSPYYAAGAGSSSYTANMQDAGQYASPATPSSPSPTPFSTSAVVASPRPRRYILRSVNPFGNALTTTYAPLSSHKSSAYDQSSYKTQFKKAYLTESNWLKGPGRVLSTQTSSDDGVVTSLGFDNEWIVVGMATSQVHVFDAKTGEYARELRGHTLGVWCLVLVNKGGERLNADGSKIKQPKPAWEEMDTAQDGSDTEEGDDERTGASSEVLQRCRSASARPPDIERFFQNASVSLSPVPTSSGGSLPNHLSDSQAGKTPSMPSPSFIARPGTTPLVSPDKSTNARDASSVRVGRNRRPSSFSGVPSYVHANHRTASVSSAGFPFGDSGKTSPQQASACGTASGWGQKGAVAVTAGCDRDVRVWDVESG